MSVKAVYQGKTVTLTDELGVGGEAVVYGYKNLAFKVYHQASAERDAKLRDYLNGIPQFVRIKGPIDIAQDASTGALISVMNRLDPQAEKLRQYSVRKWRTLNSRTVRDVAQIFDSALETLRGVHRHGAVWGDVNKYGIFALREEGHYVADWVDADAIQFGPHLCYFINLQSADPLLLPIDFNKTNRYTPTNDYASLLILFLEAALLTKPYGGNHPSYDEMARIKNGITVFSSGVVVPDMALSFDYLSDDLLHLYERWFKSHIREELKESTFTDFETRLITCPTCSAVYPRERHSCPACSTVIPLTAQHMTDHVKTLLSIDGTILSYLIEGERVIALCKEGNSVMLRDGKSRGGIGSFPDGVEYHIANETLIVQSDGTTSDGLAADSFDGRPVVGAGGVYHYRIVNGALRRAEKKGVNWIDRILLSVPSGKSTMVVDPHRDRTCGYSRTITSEKGVFYHHWATILNDNFTLDIPALRSGELLIDFDAKFASSSILVLRRTAYRGNEYVYADEVNLQGKRLSGQVSKDWEEGLDTCAYSTGIILRTTDKGVLQLNLKDQKQHVFMGTQSLVSAGDSLELYKAGLLIVKHSSILYFES